MATTEERARHAWRWRIWDRQVAPLAPCPKSEPARQPLARVADATDDS